MTDLRSIETALVLGTIALSPCADPKLRQKYSKTLCRSDHKILPQVYDQPYADYTSQIFTPPNTNDFLQPNPAMEGTHLRNSVMSYGTSSEWLLSHPLTSKE